MDVLLFVGGYEYAIINANGRRMVSYYATIGLEYGYRDDQNDAEALDEGEIRIQFETSMEELVWLNHGAGRVVVAFGKVALPYSLFCYVVIAVASSINFSFLNQ